MKNLTVKWVPETFTVGSRVVDPSPRASSTGNAVEWAAPAAVVSESAHTRFIVITGDTVGTASLRGSVR